MRGQITDEQLRELEKARKKNKDKNIERRMRALIMFAQGSKRETIAEQTGYNKNHISELVGKYVRYGFPDIIPFVTAPSASDS